MSLESERLLQELDPGTALTHQNQDSSASTPLYYKRAEVLASAKTLKADMDQMDEILNLLLISQAPRRNEGTGESLLREEDVTQAPIVNIPPPSREQELRLELFEANVSRLTDQANNLCRRVDALLELHSSIVTTVSRNFVWAHEEISEREQRQKAEK